MLSCQGLIMPNTENRYHLLLYYIVMLYYQLLMTSLNPIQSLQKKLHLNHNPTEFPYLFQRIFSFIANTSFRILTLQIFLRQIFVQEF